MPSLDINVNLLKSDMLLKTWFLHSEWSEKIKIIFVRFVYNVCFF